VISHCVGPGIPAASCRVSFSANHYQALVRSAPFLLEAGDQAGLDVAPVCAIESGATPANAAAEASKRFGSCVYHAESGMIGIVLGAASARFDSACWGDILPWTLDRTQREPQGLFHSAVPGAFGSPPSFCC
jgi:hypothetical protein